MSTLAQFSCSKFIFQQERASIIISDVISNKTRKISARGNASNNKWHIMAHLTFFFSPPSAEKMADI
jgi:hypothetical protein